MEFLIWFLFGDLIIVVFMVVLTVACFKVLGDLIGFPTEEVGRIVNMLIHYFWPAVVAGGLLSGRIKKKRVALICVVVWVLILVLYCFVPGNVTVPKAEKVASVDVYYAYNLIRIDDKVNYDYKGHSIKDPALIAQIIENIDDAKYTFTHREVLTKMDDYHDRLMVDFVDAQGKTIKSLTLINRKGFWVESRFFDRYYRIRNNSGFDAEMLYALAYNGTL